MIRAFSDSLPMSMGVVLSPVPVAAVITMLMTNRARTNAPVFLLGWISGMLAVGMLVFLIPGIQTSQGEPTRLAGVIRIALGIIFLLLAVRQWQRRPAAEAIVETPKLLVHIDNIGVAQSLITGFLLSGVNPKNLLLVAAGAAAIRAAEPNFGSQILVLLAFAALSSLSVAVPVAGYFLIGRRAEAMLGDWKDWLIRNNGTVLIVLLLVVGVLMMGQGLKIVAS